MNALGVTQSLSGQAWRWRRPQSEEKLGTALLDELLLGRGVSPHELDRYRNPTLRDLLPDPSHFRDMDAAAERVADAVLRGETVAIFGDYDVDGATSSALLVLLLRQLGVEALVHIPDRQAEGYGPNLPALLALKARGASLIVTVDCGAQAFESLAGAREAGLDVVVVDHHQCAAALPLCHALVNPNRLDEGETGMSHGHVAAVGMAFLLGVALVRTLRGKGFFAARPEPRVIELLDLVALGTVADVAKLHGLNRAFVTQGLKVMAGGRNLGLSALAEAARLKGPPTCRDLGFALGPRINAGGRVGRADLGVRLLTTTDPEEARAIAQELDRLNEERRGIEQVVLDEALAQALAMEGDPVVTVAAEGWHPGVIGIVAGRIKERVGKPSFVVAVGEDGIGKGSGRSITGVDLGAAVLAAKDEGFAIGGGGHAMAAGVTLAPGGVGAFRDYLGQRLADDVAKATANRALILDTMCAPRGIAGGLCDSLDQAGPYGVGWPQPRVAAGEARLIRVGVVGNGHVRGIACGADGASFKWIAFRAADTPLGQALLAMPGDRKLWLAGTVHRDSWNGGEAAELHLEDAALA
ncbi:single-stranded-DNA-specific exonuclease [Sphingomonas kaistensis]|uniref:Single-stranded-DNA-specific exonuclease RecJ n=1 Tax=Sphingomonas kaistensis TaxID=298708 RepID=A0A7X6BFZ5_9SPHN|nr:single-stranded-DNA-specific exonuclease RecJ [Sphingomonas kaistensis]NJC04477.1 single-stranded-DNA-specific exonuclease [Sphingomonas kaistensis]